MRRALWTSEVGLLWARRSRVLHPTGSLGASQTFQPPCRRACARPRCPLEALDHCLRRCCSVTLDALCHPPARVQRRACVCVCESEWLRHSLLCQNPASCPAAAWEEPASAFRGRQRCAGLRSLVDRSSCCDVGCPPASPLDPDSPYDAHVTGLLRRGGCAACPAWWPRLPRQIPGPPASAS